MSTYVKIESVDPNAPIWLFHLESHTLAQLHFSAIHGTSHLLKIRSDQAPPDAAIAAFAILLEKLIPGGSNFLGVLTREDSTTVPPHYLLMSSYDRAADGLIIHYPQAGLTAGIRGDGSKIDPHWRAPIMLNYDQALRLLQHAADTLMTTLAAGIAKHQAT